jgi:hypothetical protein
LFDPLAAVVTPGVHTPGLLATMARQVLVTPVAESKVTPGVQFSGTSTLGAPAVQVTVFQLGEPVLDVPTLQGADAATTAGGVLQTVEVYELVGDLAASTQPTAGSTNTVPPFAVQTFSVNGELARRVVPAAVQVLLGVPAFTTTVSAQVVVTPPENTRPGEHEPFNGLAALKTVSVHVVATKPGPLPNVVPTVQDATPTLAVAFWIEQVDLIQLGVVAGVMPGVQTLPMKAVF